MKIERNLKEYMRININYLDYFSRLNNKTTKKESLNQIRNTLSFRVYSLNKEIENLLILILKPIVDRVNIFFGKF